MEEPPTKKGTTGSWPACRPGKTTSSVKVMNIASTTLLTSTSIGPHPTIATPQGDAVQMTNPEPRRKTTEAMEEGNKYKRARVPINSYQINRPKKRRIRTI